jgi:hypothetical protein
MKNREAQMVKALDKAIAAILTRLSESEGKGSVADLARMLHLRGELTETQTKEVTVRWVDECQTSNSNEE